MTTDQVQVRRQPTRRLNLLLAEIIQELSKPTPDLAIIATLLRAHAAMPVTVAREVTKERHRKRRLVHRPQVAVPTLMKALRLYLGTVAYNHNGQPVWPVTLITTNAFQSTWRETLTWSRVLADSPHDAMGEEHFQFMGRFQAYGDAAPDTFEVLALVAFEQRLALSRKYGTWFAEQVSPGWRNGNPRKRYLERWNGVYDRLVWSFGILGHPRADQIWNLMRERLPLDPDTTTREFPQDVMDIEVALRPETKAIRSWTFHYQELDFSIYEDPNGNFFLCHARSHDIRRVIRPRLAKLWNATLNRHKSYSERLRCLAEFEWLWYWTNPFVRGGATTGGLLSAFLQRSLRNEGLKIRIPEHFVMQDLYALSCDWVFYVRERVAELTYNKGNFITANEDAM
ncbi:hypothetical protein F4777DRAFT_597385 [Nemania sp. FL0916]|nr:hypothetical protein F4777DRAFT_597385 [Nemania sp. FL0916]